MKAALNRKTSAHQPFWNSVAQNMTPEGLQRFETLLKNDVPPSFEYTVESFGKNSYYDIKKDSESTLYVIAYGADDYIVDDAIPDNVLETLRTGLETLIKRDKTIHIVINHLCQFNHLPAMKQLSKEHLQAVQDKISLHNSKLDLILEELGQKYPDIKVTTVSSGSEMVAQSQEKNISLEPCLTVAEDNSKSENSSVVHVPCMTTRTFIADDIVRSGSSLKAVYRFSGKNVKECNQPENHLFYDDFNTTSLGHKLAADLVCNLLAEKGNICQ